jgi:hypothetical protein
MTATELGISRMTVYCDGPADVPHARTVLRRYLRMPVPGPLAWFLLPATGNVPESRSDWPDHGDAIRLRCRDCRLDLKRSLDHRYGRDYPPFTAVFERLHAAGVDEISARALDRLAHRVV